MVPLPPRILARAKPLTKKRATVPRASRLCQHVERPTREARNVAEAEAGSEPRFRRSHLHAMPSAPHPASLLAPQACIGLVHQHIRFMPKSKYTPHIKLLCKWMTYWFASDVMLKFFRTGKRVCVWGGTGKG